jgi:exodeoxyribonuclease VII large subunit
VTSPSGAVFHDICTVLQRRWPLVEVVLAPTPVQGAEAVPGIINALHDLKAGTPVDLVIVARGGGSIEDLAAFNDEMVARAIFSFPVPVISAVGHETDVTIADYVADVRAPTPSAAAELAAPDHREMRMRLYGFANALTSGVDDSVRRASDDLREMVRWMDRRSPDFDRPRQGIDDRLRRAALALERHAERKRGVVERALVRLLALSPLDTLGRGYAVVQRVATGEVVNQVAQVQPGDRLRIRVQDGAFTAQTGGASPGTRARRAVPQEQLALELDSAVQG